MKVFKLLAAAALGLAAAIVPDAALAHEGEALPFGSFLGGLTHPVLGFDHLLAMVSVGMLSAQIGGRAIWTVPATFVAVMAAGAAIGLSQIGLPVFEVGIAMSVIVLGFAIAAGRRLPVLMAMVGVALFAVFHGYAHGVEMPAIAEPVRYAAGFLAGTAAIHIAGVFVGDISQHYERGKLALRVLGGLIAAVGLLLITGVL